MIIRLAGALGVAVLALSFSLGNSSACSKAAEESVTEDTVADVGVPAPDISEPRLGEIAPSNAANESVAEASAIAPALAAPSVEMPEAAITVIPAQKQDDSADLSLAASIAAITGKIKPSPEGSEPSVLSGADIAEWKLIFDEASAPSAAVIETPAGAAPATVASIAAIIGRSEPSSDVNEPSTPEFQAAAGVLTESDVAEWKLIFDAASAPAAPGTVPATIGAIEANPAETVEAWSR